jgi:hypothetical protein
MSRRVAPAEDVIKNPGEVRQKVSSHYHQFLLFLRATYGKEIAIYWEKLTDLQELGVYTPASLELAVSTF